MPTLSIQCINCLQFRCLETYPNILGDPKNAQPLDLDLIKKRRTVEKQLILDLEQKFAEEEVSVV